MEKEDTNPVRGGVKGLMGLGMKPELVLKTDRLGWGPCKPC